MPCWACSGCPGTDHSLLLHMPLPLPAQIWRQHCLMGVFLNCHELSRASTMHQCGTDRVRRSYRGSQQTSNIQSCSLPLSSVGVEQAFRRGRRSPSSWYFAAAIPSDGQVCVTGIAGFARRRFRTIHGQYKPDTCTHGDQPQCRQRKASKGNVRAVVVHELQNAVALASTQRWW